MSTLQNMVSIELLSPAVSMMYLIANSVHLTPERRVALGWDTEVAMTT